MITDPYTPGPDGSGFDPIDEPADLVIMSSTTDRFHSDPSHVRGNPMVVDALALLPEGATVHGVPIRPFPAMENLHHDFGRDPDANAMYLFTIGGVRVLHLGDIGNPIAPEQLAALRGQVDVLLALAGGRATIALDDLDAAIAAIGPRVVIPMHYYSARGAEDPAGGRFPRASARRNGRAGRRAAADPDAGKSPRDVASLSPGAIALSAPASLRRQIHRAARWLSAPRPTTIHPKPTIWRINHMLVRIDRRRSRGGANGEGLTGPGRGGGSGQRFRGAGPRTTPIPARSTLVGRARTG